MSITKDFEKRLLPIEHSTVYGKDETEALLEHARALETMLKKHERSADGHRCPECNASVATGILVGPDNWAVDDYGGHAPDCELAKLLKDVGASD